jgi:hypothetical protein
MPPRYPLYVISKGRWESRFTSKALEAMGTPYRIVVEPQEFDHYAEVIDPAKILTLPFSNLGQGSIPARNWVWRHSIEEGHDRHWIIDDNIAGFYRFNRNLKTPVGDSTIFRVMEDFTERYVNVPMSGPNYFMFVTRKSGDTKPYALNTRVYSCILLSNKVLHRWRGRYNEDTDLSLRFLKDGYCTLLFNAFLALKLTTMSVKGGNTAELYRQDKAFDGRLEMARSLYRQHPDVTKIARKWGRWQHVVDYSGFKEANRLLRRPGLDLPDEVDNYGMVLKTGLPRRSPIRA